MPHPHHLDLFPVDVVCLQPGRFGGRATAKLWAPFPSLPTPISPTHTHLPRARALSPVNLATWPLFLRLPPLSPLSLLGPACVRSQVLCQRSHRHQPLARGLLGAIIIDLVFAVPRRWRVFVSNPVRVVSLALLKCRNNCRGS